MSPELTITLEFGPHAPLLTRYNLKSREHEVVGSCCGVYANEDRYGREYRVIGNEVLGKEVKIMTSTSYGCGFFYPSTLFLTGEEHGGESIEFGMLDQIAAKLFAHRENKQVILPRGYDKGKNTWWNAIQFVRAGEWWWSERPRMIKKFTGVDVIESRHNLVQIEIPNFEAWLNQ